MFYRSDSYIVHHENNGRRFPHKMQNSTKLDSREKRRAENTNIFMLKIARIQDGIKWPKVVKGGGVLYTRCCVLIAHNIGKFIN